MTTEEKIIKAKELLEEASEDVTNGSITGDLDYIHSITDSIEVAVVTILDGTT